MTATQHSNGPRRGGWLERLRRVRVVLAGAAIVFGGLWWLGIVAPFPALAGFVLIATAAVIGARGSVAAVPQPAAADLRPTLRAGDPLLEAVLSGLPDPVVALNGSGEVVALNAHAATLAPALRRGEQVSLGLRNPEVLDAIRRAAASGAVQRVEFIVRVPVERWYEAIVTPIAAAAASAPLVLMTFHDLTPLRRVEEMRADFVANASHELRTPLAALSGFIDTLRGPARDDPVARERFLAIMQAQATRMARLIHDLLSLSRIELNVHLRPDKQVDLVSIVRQVVDGLQTLARDRGVEVKVTAPADQVVVLGDRDELLRVFENLVENALKYAASGKRLDISLAAAATPKAEARVAVRDYGPGIAPEHLPRLTERFYRVDVSESRAQGGTGLGLALVKHILNRHGGRLTIESAPGQGACFTALLPFPGAAGGESSRLSTKG
ncbi:MAG: two-component system, OmpR family, phosphate regulon sensor histidine kinase PhoR [Alphaproteobacteria bacterium]|nr:two-component system, OmpR family, phosphate regulon sensor histidine kinase PhoR [Alphaproteobacteria bacterium]